MAIRLHTSIAAAFLCGAVGFAGASFAQGVPSGAPLGAPVGAPAGDLSVPTDAVIPAPNLPDPGAVPAPPAVPGLEAIGPAPQPPLAAPETPVTTMPSAGNPTPQTPAVAAADAHSGNGLFGLDLKNTSTKARGLTKARRARVERNERSITSELNRASATNTTPLQTSALPSESTTE